MVLTRCLGSGWYGHVATCALGAITALSLAPFHLSYLSLLSALALLYLLRELSVCQALLRGSAYGLGLFLAGTYWIFISVYHYSNSGLLAALVIVCGLSAFMASQIGLWWAVWAYTRFLGNCRYLLLFPACWVLGEWTTTWLAGGFPWMLAGYAHLDSPLNGWAPIFGVLGISFALSATAGALYCLLNRRAMVLATLMLFVLWGGGFALSHLEWTQATKNNIRVAIIQANIPLTEKFDEAYHPLNRQRYWQLLEPLWGKVDLIVMPETAVAAVTPEGRKFIGRLQDKARTTKTALITGISERVAPNQVDQKVHYYNSVLGLGHARGLVRKRKLVPFGEFVPMEEWLRGLIPFLDLPLSSFDHGPNLQKPLSLNKHPLDAFICYEIIFADLVSQNISPEGVLLTISEDAWFGDSSAPRQHLHMARMRSLEQGREMIRGTNRGISAIVDYRGRVRRQAPFMQQDILIDEINIRSGKTPFAHWGSLPILILSQILVLCGLAWARWASRRSIIYTKQNA